MTESDLEAFETKISEKNSWGKNEVIGIFRKWVLSVALKELAKK